MLNGVATRSLGCDWRKADLFPFLADVVNLDRENHALTIDPKLCAVSVDTALVIISEQFTLVYSERLT